MPAKCSYILSPESITLGNVVKLEVIGCTGTASWKAGLTDIGTGQIIYHTPLSSTTYSMSCDQPVCDVSRTVSVESSDFTVTAAKTFAKIAEPVLLNSSGCSGGTIQWSTGETGEVITVRPLSETTYIASCILNGISVSDKNVAIKVDNAPPEDITCPDFQLQVPEGNFPKDAMVTIQPVNCPAGSKIIWSDGTVAGNTELYIVKLSEGQKVSATCVTPYQMKVKAEVSLAISDGVISVSPTSVTNNVPTVLTASGCFYNETYQWKNGSTIQSSVQSITVQLTKATTYTVSCLDNTGTIRKSRDFPITVTGSGLNCDNLGITEFNGKSARDINSAYYLVAPAEAIKMKFTCDGCSGSLVWSVNGERIENGENGTIDNQTLTYETIAPFSPGELTYRVNVNGCEKTFKVAVFSCDTYKANIAWDGRAAYATISASYCPAYASVFDNAGSTPITTLTSPSGQPNEYQSTVGQGTYKVICNVRGLDNQDRAYTISKLSFTNTDFTSRKAFNRASYCDDVSGPANESCLLDISQVNKNNGLIGLRVTNSSSCTTGIVWTSDGGASGSGETLTVKQPENDKTEYYTASCNSEKCKGGTWVNGPYTPSADNPCKGLDKDFSRTYTKDEPVILQMSNCPGTVTWFKDPNRQDLICTLPTAAGKTTFTVGKLNATTLYYYNCQLKDGTICQSVGAAKIKGSSNGRVAADNVSKTTTTGQIANTPLSTSGSNMRVASTVIEEVCSNSVSLTSVMKEFYSKMLCQDVNIYTGDRIVAEKYLDQLLSRIPNNVSGTVIKSPSDKSGVIEKMYEGKCEDAVDLLVAPNNGVMVPVADANDNVVSRYGQIHDASIEEVVIIPKIISQLAEEAQIADALVNCEGSRRLGNIKFQGTLEHWLIQYDYIYSQNLNAFMEFKIPKSSPSGNLGYADLAVPITGEIFEIKPDNDQGIRAGRNEVENYISKANLECPNPLQWKKGLNYKPRILPYPKQPLKQLVTRLEEGGVIVYNVQDKSGKPQPVLVPQNILDKIKKWVDRIGQNPQNLEREIVVFLRENPEVATYLKGVAVGAAAGIVVATIVEDVITAGVGIADDWASFALAYKLVRVAQIL